MSGSRKPPRPIGPVTALLKAGEYREAKMRVLAYYMRAGANAEQVSHFKPIGANLVGFPTMMLAGASNPVALDFAKFRNASPTTANGKWGNILTKAIFNSGVKERREYSFLPEFAAEANANRLAKSDRARERTAATALLFAQLPLNDEYVHVPRQRGQLVLRNEAKELVLNNKDISVLRVNYSRNPLTIESSENAEKVQRLTLLRLRKDFADKIKSLDPTQRYRLVVSLIVRTNQQDSTHVVFQHYIHSPKDALHQLSAMFNDSLTATLMKGSSSDDAVIVGMQVLCIKYSDAGGCCTRVLKQTNRSAQTIDNRTGKVKDRKHAGLRLQGREVVSVRSKNNNCFFASINHCCGIDSTTLNANKIRGLIGLSPNSMVPHSFIPAIQGIYAKNKKQAYHFSVRLYDHEMNLIAHYPSSETGATECEIALVTNHYVVVGPACDERVPCEGCGTIHEVSKKCDMAQWAYRQRELLGNKVLVIKDKSHKENLNLSRVIHYDLETFPDAVTRISQVYALGVKCLDDEQIVYGDGADPHKCMDWFLQHLSDKQGRVVSAYNGAGFDHMFLYKHMNRRDSGYWVRNTVISGGLMLNFEFAHKSLVSEEDMKVLNTPKAKGRRASKAAIEIASRFNRVFDINRFIVGSLDSACTNYKVVNAKRSFDHNKIKCWADAAEHRGEVEPYLLYDCKALAELFGIFQNVIFEHTRMHITDFYTLPSLSYAYWLTLLEPGNVPSVPSAECYALARRAIKGGRVYPGRKHWRSSEFDMVKAMTVEQRIAAYSGISDYIFNADVCSLYPAAMMNEMPLDECPTEVEMPGFMGMYECNVTCPQNLWLPVLGNSKYKNGKKVGLAWNLQPKEDEVYTNIEIEDARRFGYVVTVKRGIYWKRSSPYLRAYVEKIAALKAQATVEDNTAARSSFKLMLNSLFGKMSQRAIVERKQMCYDVTEVIEFLEKYTMTNYINMEGKIFVIGTLTSESDIAAAVTKPSHVGAFVLAYSKRIMLNLFEKIDPTLTTPIFNYTDTDSMHIHASHLDKLADVLGEEIGELNDDIKGGGKILEEYLMGPKSYMYIYVNPRGEIKTVMKNKGINSKYLTEDLYRDGYAGEFHKRDDHGDVLVDSKGKRLPDGKSLALTQFKRDQTKTTKIVKGKAVQVTEPFSVRILETRRSFMKTVWNGMRCDEDEVYWPLV
jgi:hypothetical protein